LELLNKLSKLFSILDLLTYGYPLVLVKVTDVSSIVDTTLQTVLPTNLKEINSYLNTDLDPFLDSGVMILLHGQEKLSLQYNLEKLLL
jgi:predicted thioredoxin/glutaredoxin